MQNFTASMTLNFIFNFQYLELKKTLLFKYFYSDFKNLSEISILNNLLSLQFNVN